MTAPESPKPKSASAKRTAKWRRTPPPPRSSSHTNRGITIDQIAAALRASAGIAADAAKILGVSRANVSQRIKKHKPLQEAQVEIKEETLDLAESMLIQQIQSGNLGAICFYLRTQGKARAYGEGATSVSVETDAGKAKVHVYIPQKDPLPEDE